MENNLIKFCGELLQTKSYSGSENAVAEKIRDEALKLKYDEAWIDDWGNVICLIKGAGDKKILFDGHMDTVPVSEEKWTRDPFGGEIEGGRIYGRGASDMKGSLSAMIYGLSELIPVKNQLDGDIYVSGTVCEEVLEGVALGKVLDQVYPDFVVIGEASEMKLKIGQRGRAEIVVESLGKGAHSANPGEGYNAVYALSDFISLMKVEPPTLDQFLGEGISVLTDIHSEPYPGASVVPYYARATYDRRLLTGEDRAQVVGQYEKIIASLKAEDSISSIKASLAFGEMKTYTGKMLSSERFFPAWKMDEDSECVAAGKAALSENGLETEVSKYSFCTNGSMSAGIRGIPTVGFGPGMECLAHIDDEYISIDELTTAAKVYASLGRKYLQV